LVAVVATVCGTGDGAATHFALKTKQRAGQDHDRAGRPGVFSEFSADRIGR